MAQERIPKFWQEQIKNGQRFQIKFGGYQEWRRYKQYYRHEFNRGVLPVNQIFSIMRSVVAQTYFKNPTITVTPTKPGLIHKLHARLIESIDRWLVENRRTESMEREEE